MRHVTMKWGTQLGLVAAIAMLLIGVVRVEGDPPSDLTAKGGSIDQDGNVSDADSVTADTADPDTGIVSKTFRPPGSWSFRIFKDEEKKPGAIYPQHERIDLILSTGWTLQQGFSEADSAINVPVKTTDWENADSWPITADGNLKGGSGGPAGQGGETPHWAAQVNSVVVSAFPAEISTFTNTRNVIDVTVEPASAASNVTLVIADTSIARFANGTGQLTLSSSPQTVEIRGVPNAPGSTSMSYVLSGSLSGMQATSSAPRSAPKLIEAKGAQAQAAESESGNSLVSIDTAKMSITVDYGIDQLEVNLADELGDAIADLSLSYQYELLADMINNGSPEERAAGFAGIDYLNNQGGSAAVTQASNLLALTALQWVTGTLNQSGNLSTFDTTSAISGGYTPIVPPGQAGLDSYDIDPIFRLRDWQFIVDNIGTPQALFANPNNWVSEVGAGIQINIGEDHVIKSSVVYKFGEEYLHRADTVKVDLEFQFYNWKDWFFSVKPYMEFGPSSGSFEDYGVQVGAELRF